MHNTADLSRETIILGGIYNMHIFSGNNAENDGGKEISFADNEARLTGGFKKISDLIVEHENVDFSGDFGPAGQFVDLTDGPGTEGTYIDLDMGDPGGSLSGYGPEWLVV